MDNSRAARCKASAKQNKLRQLCLTWMREFHPDIVAKLQRELGIHQPRVMSSELSSIYKKVTEETT